MRRAWAVFALVLVLAAACTSASGTPTPGLSPVAATAAGPTASPAPTRVVVPEGSFQNPVLRNDFPDPFILAVGDTYYAYATNANGKNVQVSSSTDLVTWQLLPDAMPALPKWTTSGSVWAPEVLALADKYVLYYTSHDKASNRQCVGVAVSDEPQGHFKDTRDQPLVCQVDQGGTIDASPFRDGDQLYLYFKNDGNCCGIPTYLYVQPLAPDGLSLVGEATPLVRNDEQWEGRVVEAPQMLRHAEQYYLFFSANNYAGVEYAVGYALCDTALGPCTDAPENPILASRMDQQPLVIGPGHQTIVTIGDETWMVYHVWEVVGTGRRGDRRFMWMDRLDWVDGKPDVLGPTTDPQPDPLP
jgi:beta-xylosidase